MVLIKNSATLILLRDTEAGLELLMMRRSQSVKFLGGFWVFPGGAVEPHDVVSDAVATARKAAVRETQEEAGITIDEQSLISYDHWTTPKGASKRFATRFFIAPMNNQQQVQHDGSEMVDSLWLTPHAAIARHKCGEMDVLPPTYISLLALSKFTSVAEAIAAMEKHVPQYFLPKPCVVDNTLIMLYPGDAGYEVGDASIEGGRHRCVHENKSVAQAAESSRGWQYINNLM